jgi:hypothetical protein
MQPLHQVALKSESYFPFAFSGYSTTKSYILNLTTKYDQLVAVNQF